MNEATPPDLAKRGWITRSLDLVERLLDRGLSTDPQRPITRNRQPGKCCDTGCTAPGAPVMVDLPQSTKTGEKHN